MALVEDGALPGSRQLDMGNLGLTRTFRTVFALAAVVALAVSIAVACGAREETPPPTPTSAPVPTPTEAPRPAAAPAAQVENLPMYLGGLGRTGSFDTAPAVFGTVKWKFKVFPNTSGSPTVARGVVYQGSGTRLFAVEAESGEELWRFETDGIIRGSPAVSDAVVYIGSADGRLYAVDAVTGEEKWRFQTGDKVYSSPAVVDGVVYVGSKDRHLFALDVGLDAVALQGRGSGLVLRDLHRDLEPVAQPAVDLDDQRCRLVGG